MTTSEAQAAARNAAARTHAGERRKLVRAVGELLDQNLDAIPANGLKRPPRSIRTEGHGWMVSYHRADGQPGSEILQVNINLGPRHRERFGS